MIAACIMLYKQVAYFCSGKICSEMCGPVSIWHLIITNENLFELVHKCGIKQDTIVNDFEMGTLTVLIKGCILRYLCDTNLFSMALGWGWRVLFCLKYDMLRYFV